MIENIRESGSISKALLAPNPDGPLWNLLNCALNLSYDIPRYYADMKPILSFLSWFIQFCENYFTKLTNHFSFMKFFIDLKLFICYLFRFRFFVINIFSRISYQIYWNVPNHPSIMQNIKINIKYTIVRITV